MAVHTEEIKETSGHKKKINSGAYSMVFDNLQKSNYKYPIKSTIRELVSNGIDAIRERKNSVAILKGKAKESDFYYVMGTDPETDESITQSPGLYADSVFNRDYYNLNYLEQQKESVEVMYMENSILNRDVLIIRDCGVGLWGSRLEGYFDLAFSTKRLNKDSLGKFGLGSKVPLSLRVPYFTMYSRYNGQEVAFNIYSEDVENIIPPTNLDTGEIHQKHVFSKENPSDPDEIYFSRKTELKNGTEIRVEVKKHYKTDIISAVQNQLLYFKNVTLTVVDEYYEVKQELPVQADILYEDDFIIISDNNQFSKPHIVINNVSYGYLDYLEMEIEEKSGNIGIKVSPTEVEVSHSRESVIWSEQTKTTILNRFKQVKDIAADYVSQKLVQTDYLKWLQMCQAVLHGNNSMSSTEAKVLKAFGGVSDMKELSFKFSLDKTIKYSNNPQIVAPKSLVHVITRKMTRKGENMVAKLDRSVPITWPINMPVFVKYEKYSFRKDMYLTSLYPNGYAVISYPKLELPEEASLFTAKEPKPQSVDFNKRWKLIKASEGVLVWDEIEVPESFLIRDEDENEEVDIITEGTKTVVKVSEKARRKLEGKIIAYTPRVIHRGTTISKDDMYYLYEAQKLEIKPVDVERRDIQLYYGTKEYEVLLHLAASLTRPAGQNYDQFAEVSGINDYYLRRCTSWGSEAKIHLLQVSKENEGYFAQDWAHITKFFSSIDNGIITMDKQLIKWNTARIIHKEINASLKFLNNYSSIDAAIAEKFNEVLQYYYAHFVDYVQLISNGYVHATRDIFDSLLEHMDKLTELHVLCAMPEIDESVITKKAISLFPEDPASDSIRGAVGVDLKIYEKLQHLLEYAEPLYTMLNMNYKLTNTNKATISLEEELEIKQFIHYKTI